MASVRVLSLALLLRGASSAVQVGPSKLATTRYQSNKHVAEPMTTQQQYQVPQYEEDIDGVAVSTPKGELLSSRLRSVLANAKVRARHAAVAAEWTVEVRPVVERMALEYLEYVNTCVEAQEYIHQSMAEDERFMQAILAKKFSPNKVCQRVAETVDETSLVERGLAPVSHKDTSAIWALFKHSVRGLLGGEEGWRRKIEWRLLRELHTQAVQRGRHRAASLVMMASDEGH